MAVITPTQLAYDVASASLPVTGLTAIVHGNTDTIAYPKTGKLLIVMNNTTAGAGTITFNAGDFTANGLGNLDVAFTQDQVKFIVVSSDRLKQSDGTLSIDYSASMTGYIGAFYLP